MVPKAQTSELKKSNLETGRLSGHKNSQPNLLDMIIGVCLLLFFRATELITLHLCRQCPSCLAALPSLSPLCDTCKSLSPIIIKHCRYFFFFLSQPNASSAGNRSGFFFFFLVCACARAYLCARARTSTCVITQKLAKGDDLFCSTLRLTHPLVLHQEAEA